jgi:sec-independent protein translocase protein TatA
MAAPAWYNLRGRGLNRPPSEKEFMGNLGIPELLIILCIIILVFGANRLPEIGRGIGRGIRNFKDATKDGTEGAEKS